MAPNGYEIPGRPCHGWLGTAMKHLFQPKIDMKSEGLNNTRDIRYLINNGGDLITSLLLRD